MSKVDLNCDMGESYGAWKMGADAGIFGLFARPNAQPMTQGSQS